MIITELPCCFKGIQRLVDKATAFIAFEESQGRGSPELSNSRSLLRRLLGMLDRPDVRREKEVESVFWCALLSLLEHGFDEWLVNTTRES